MAKTYYEILGVSQNADDRTLKRAFRKLSQQYHPDKNSSEEAQVKFKEINLAYNILSDPEKRSLYDRIGHDAFVNSNGQAGGFGGGFEGFDFGEFGDIFSQFFGGASGSPFGDFGSQRGGQQGGVKIQGADIELEIGVTLEQLYNNEKITITYTRNIDCEECNGKGAKEEKDLKTCPSCNGNGTIYTHFGAQVCNNCRGRGKVVTKACKKCKGEGVNRKTESFEYKLENIRPGINLRFRGYGHEAGKGTIPGNLIVGIRLKDDSIFRYQDGNLVLTYPISFITASLGTKVEIPYFNNEVIEVEIKKGTQHGDYTILRGKGLTVNNRKGDIVIYFDVRTIENPTKEQQDLLEKLNDTLKDNHLGTKQQGFIKKLKGLLGKIKK